MSDRLKALREQRGQIVTEMRGLIEAAEKEKRDLSGEEAAKHAELFKKQDELRHNIEATERQIELDREMAAAAADDAKRAKPDPNGKPAAQRDGDATPEMQAFRKFILRGIGVLSNDEKRALQAGVDQEGGYLRPPPQFIASLLKGLDDMVFIRSRATRLQVAASNSIGVPTLDADVDDADWTTELQTGSEDTALRFGKRELRTYPMAKRIKVSKTLLRASALPIETIIRDRIAYKIGLTQEKAYLTGNGNQRPLGLFTASNDGIPTGRDVSTGNTSTAITFDGLIEAKFAVKAPYWPQSVWLFHRDAVKNITKLKDGEGQYLWRMSVRDGEPDSLLGRPLLVSEHVPNTFTSQQYVGLYGDLSYYWIADALDMQLQRLVELYAESNQDGFIARYEGDGMPVLAEAFARVKLG